ncbi:MAG: tRNA lysidine(34) synthetase TilS [Pseudomonadota bacterium]
MSFSPDWLRRRLDSLGAGDAQRLVVAYSGGLDSTALLHATCRCGVALPVSAVHVNHQLHDDARQWQAHCEAFAHELGVAIESFTVQVDADHEAGPEAAARDARYSVFVDHLRDGDVLLSAHHLDDQAETLLLNLMRASGPLGLSGIPGTRPLGAGRLMRPLLDVPRSALRAYADAEQLLWIDDPGNAETAFDRNFLRHEVIPLLQTRWSNTSGGLARSAALMAEASTLQDDLAAVDLGDTNPGRLPVDRLTALGDVRARNLIRYAVRQQRLPPPPATALGRILTELLPARDDAQPLVAWSGAEARRYRNELFLSAAMTQQRPAGGELAPGGVLDLGVLGQLRAERDAPTGVSPDLADTGFRVDFRVGGEELQPDDADHQRPLKKLLQEAGVLPWMRRNIPLLYCGEQLVAVGDLWIERSAVAEPGVAIHWENRPVIR